MGKKNKRREVKPWCWYCEREFDDDKVLINHQRAKHFKCPQCNKRLNSASAMMIHYTSVHKEILDIVPNALPQKCSPHMEIFGMSGIPPQALLEWEMKIMNDTGGGGGKRPKPSASSDSIVAPADLSTQSLMPHVISPPILLPGMQAPFMPPPYLLPAGMPPPPIGYPPASALPGMFPSMQPALPSPTIATSYTMPKVLMPQSHVDSSNAELDKDSASNNEIREDMKSKVPTVAPSAQMNVLPVVLIYDDSKHQGKSIEEFRAEKYRQ